MTGDPHRPIQRTIAAHFAGRSAPRAEQSMRHHLRTCADCRGVYESQLLIAEIDPAALPAEERLARALGLRSPVSAPAVHGRGANIAWSRFTRLLEEGGWGRGAAGAGAVLAVALLLVTVRAGKAPTDSAAGMDSGDRRGVGFAARGAGVQAGPVVPEVMVYRMRARDAQPEPAGTFISPDDELAFAYRNTSGKNWLLIFAVDEHGHVYWYHPGWSNLGDDPAAVPASVAPGVHELPSAVAHQLDGDKLVVHALFSDRKLTARQVEAAVAAASVAGDAGPPGQSGQAGGEAPADRTGGVLRLPGSLDVRRPFRVLR